jgi:hypothetical protein
VLRTPEPVRWRWQGRSSRGPTLKGIVPIRTMVNIILVDGAEGGAVFRGAPLAAAARRTPRGG